MNGTFLVEKYSPGLPLEQFEAASDRIRAQADASCRVGKRVRVLRSTIVPRDEALLCLLDASSEDLVRDVFLQAGVAFDRISPALSSPRLEDAS